MIVFVCLVPVEYCFAVNPNSNVRKPRIATKEKKELLGFHLHLLEGKVFVRDGNSSLVQVKSNPTPFASNASVFCRGGSKLILGNGKARFRFFDRVTFSCRDQGIFLQAGSLLADLRAGGYWFVEGFDAKLQVSGKVVILVDSTTNGGLKLICLGGKGVISGQGSDGGKVELFPGELVFAKPQGKGFSDKLNVNLKTLVATSALVHEFPDYEGFRKDVGRAILDQQSLIRKRFRAVVGDARTPDTFDIRELSAESSASEANATDSAP